MKKAKSISNPYLYLFGSFLSIILMIIGLIIQNYNVAIVSFIIGILFSLPVLLLRKIFFAKMLIDEEGIHVFYRNKLLKEIKWNEIKMAKVVPNSFGGQIIFAKETEFNQKSSISINMNTDFALYLFKYKHKIPVPITDLDKLSKIVADRLR